MNKYWKEELDKKLKNKIFIWDERLRLWRNVYDSSDTMTDGEYEAITFALKLIEISPYLNPSP